MSCQICGRSFPSDKSLVQHTENVHGRTGVYRGVVAWENSRSQRGVITTGVDAIDYQYHVDDSQYDSQTDTWDCGMCYKTFSSKRHLEQHLNSGVHEQKRYACEECGRSFGALAALTQHLESSGHARKESRLVNVMLTDAQQSRTLMLTNGNPRSLYYECTLYFDGSAQPNPCSVGGCGWYLVDHRGVEILRDGEEVYELNGFHQVTNNQAEYSGLIGGLKAAINQGVKRIKILGDSELVVDQINGHKQVRSERMLPLYNQVMRLLAQFQTYEVSWISREQNTVADGQARLYGY